MTNTLTEHQFKTMLTLQEEMNGGVNSDWKTKDFNFSDAIFTGATEAFNHTNWEWWKNEGKAPDVDKIKLELVGVWHFILCELMMHPEPNGATYFQWVDHIIKAVAEGKPEGFIPTPEEFKESLRNLVRASLDPETDSRIQAILVTFIIAIDVIGMSWNELFKLYVGKNTLNKFRQKNGYKTDTKQYKKVWAAKAPGVEDNDYLTEILQENTEEVSAIVIWDKLDKKYAELKVEVDCSLD